MGQSFPEERKEDIEHQGQYQQQQENDTNQRDNKRKQDDLYKDYIIKIFSCGVLVAAVAPWVKWGYSNLIYYLLLNPVSKHHNDNKSTKEIIEVDGVKVKKSASYLVPVSKNGNTLDTVKYVPDSQKGVDKASRKYIVYCSGASRCHEDGVKSFAELAARLDCTIIVFNYPGVNESSGSVTSFNDLVKAAVAQGNNLIERQGINSKQIIYYGHCLGGVIATRAASELYKNGNPVSLFVDRSFRSFSSLVSHHCFQEDIGVVKSFFRAVFESIAYCILMGLRWEIKGDKIYKALVGKIPFVCLTLIADPKVRTGAAFGNVYAAESVDSSEKTQYFYMETGEVKNPVTSCPHSASLQRLKAVDAKTGIESNTTGIKFFKSFIQEKVVPFATCVPTI